MFGSQVRNIRRAQRQYEGKKLRETAHLEAVRKHGGKRVIRLSVSTRRGQIETRNHLINVVVVVIGIVAIFAARWSSVLVQSEANIVTSSTFATIPLTKLRRIGFQVTPIAKAAKSIISRTHRGAQAGKVNPSMTLQNALTISRIRTHCNTLPSVSCKSNFVHRHRPLCISSNEPGNFTHVQLWEFESGDQFCRAKDTSTRTCEVHDGYVSQFWENFASTERYAIENIHKFVGIKLPDFLNHFENFTDTGSGAWDSNLTLAIQRGHTNGLVIHTKNISEPVEGDAGTDGQLLFSKGEHRETWLAVVRGGFKVKVAGGGELNDGEATLAAGSQLYLPSPYVGGQGMKIFIESLVDGGVMIGLTSSKNQLRGNVQYPAKIHV